MNGSTMGHEMEFEAVAGARRSAHNDCLARQVQPVPPGGLRARISNCLEAATLPEGRWRLLPDFWAEEGVRCPEIAPRPGSCRRPDRAPCRWVEQTEFLLTAARYPPQGLEWCRGASCGGQVQFRPWRPGQVEEIPQLNWSRKRRRRR